MHLRLLTENQLLQLVLERRRDAQALFEKERYNGSVYMAGYAVECALKASICRQMNELKMPGYLATHDLARLSGQLPLSDGPRILLWTAMEKEPAIRRAFLQLSDAWSSEMRYETRVLDRQAAMEILAAATQITDWLRRQYM
jgi:HEPN domain-containing protein